MQIKKEAKTKRNSWEKKTISQKDQKYSLKQTNVKTKNIGATSTRFLMIYPVHWIHWAHFLPDPTLRQVAAIVTFPPEWNLCTSASASRAWTQIETEAEQKNKRIPHQKWCSVCIYVQSKLIKDLQNAKCGTMRKPKLKKNHHKLHQLIPSHAPTPPSNETIRREPSSQAAKRVLSLDKARDQMAPPPEGAVLREGQGGGWSIKKKKRKK